MKVVFLYSAVFFAITFSLTGCDAKMVYDEFADIENGSWKWDQEKDFSFEIEDTLNIHNIYINLRHSTEYPLSNLYLFVHVEGPSGQHLTDTINFILAEPSGEWIGSGIGKLREIGYLYRENTRFPQKGIYDISIEQAMRLPEVPVENVGVRVTRVQTPK